MKTQKTIPQSIFEHEDYFRFKNLLRKITFLSIILAGIVLKSFAGDVKSNNGWILSKTIDNVNFYYKIVNCNNNDYVILKFENKNNLERKITWKNAFVTKELADKNIVEDAINEVLVAPGIISQEDCNNVVHKECIINSLEVTASHHSTVTEFIFDSITVSEK